MANDNEANFTDQVIPGFQWTQDGWWQDASGKLWDDVRSLYSPETADLASRGQTAPNIQQQIDWMRPYVTADGMVPAEIRAQATAMFEDPEKDDTIGKWLPYVMAAGFGGVVGAAGGFGAAASGGGEVAAGLGGLEGAGSVTFGDLAPTLIDAGAELATPLADVAAEGGGAIVDGGVTGSGNFSWSNPFGNTPPGLSTVGQQLLDTGSDPSEFSPLSEGGGSNLDGGGGKGGFDWTKFFSGQGSGWLNLLGSGVGALSSWLASNAQVKSAEEANAMLWAMYQQNRADAGPYREAGYGALANMVNLTTPGKQFNQMQLDPGYQFRLGEGNKAIDRASAARGMYGSGRTLKELTRYGQNFASNEFGNVYNRNASLAGLGQTAVTNTGNQGATVAGQIGNNMTGIGNANASGYVGIGNAITSGLQNYSNNQNQSALIEALLAGRTY